MSLIGRASSIVRNVAGVVVRVFKAAPATLSGVNDSRGWWPIIRESFSGAWQQNVEVRQDQVIGQATVFACMTLIANDIGKLRAKLMEQSAGIWEEVASPAFSPVLRKPNRYQTWQQFIVQWVLSLLSSGNAYVLKVRDNRRVVVAMHLLDPTRCRPLVAPDGSVYYELHEDNLTGVYEPMPAVPASEIIHDRINPLFHPLVGISPIFACGLTATKGLRIEENAARFFANQSQPGGVLTAPAAISDDNAKRLKEYFELKFTGENAGKVAVLGDGLTYQPMTTNAVDAQLIEQLKWSAEQVCACFHVPGYLVGAAPVPPNNNVEALRLDYYLRCLQSLIEGIENTLDDGLALGLMADGRVLGIELDLDGLLRMDTAALTAALKEQVGAGITKPNEARRRLNLPPVAGGDTPYMQQQNYSLSALDKRDTGSDPFGKASAPAVPPATVEPAAKAIEQQFEAMLARQAELAEAARLAEERRAEQAQFIAAQQANQIKALGDGLREERRLEIDRAAAEEAAKEAELLAEEAAERERFAAFEKHVHALTRRFDAELACG